MDPKNIEAANPKSAPLQKQYPEGQWPTGLYDRCDDPSNCITLSSCPCVTFGQIAEIIDGGDRSCGISGLVYYAMGNIHCEWLYAGLYRTKLRQLFSLPEAPYGDRFVHCCCCPCSLSQEYRELKNRGPIPP
ncbi:protein PLANT CADMIUM RESISTANCE 9-like [Durio zibethinus]|uniref:Protein PLANT CADMIUM RESISTANCE 9-like n=1 Tax=Durio zibethinus TaxID=66656 RepID=A0A6P6BFH2_DURZI|nr:protein PLANT CADMIUM RESISTANCE 9-like [Durio zibethinus]